MLLQNHHYLILEARGWLEQAIIDSTLSYAIIRPTLIFGKEDILINNIAWCLRKFPIFPIFGNGKYQIQPIYVEDIAKLAVTVGAGQDNKNIILDAIGPEIYTYEEIVRLIAEKIHSRTKIIHLPPEPVFYLGKIINYLVNDVIITRNEIDGFMANLLVSNSAPTGQTRLSVWLEQNAQTVGRKYASELRRHYR